MFDGIFFLIYLDLLQFISNVIRLHTMYTLKRKQLHKNIIKVLSSGFQYFIKLFLQCLFNRTTPSMKGIQINNFFNNHISLNGKKNANKQPATFFQGNRPEPVLFSRNLNEEEPEEVASYDTLTPQMKAFNKQGAVSARKKRTNTSDQINAKQKQRRKSRGKQSNSYEKIKKAASLDKYNQKQTSQQHQSSKPAQKTSKKPKSSRAKPESSQPEGVKRSKSAIIKNINSKAIQSKQMSKQVSKHFLKQPKKSNNIISENSLKNTKKQLKKETQNLINSKQRTDRVECKTARVQSTKVKERKQKDKIIAELQKSSQKEDKKQLKYNTEKKSANNTASKSYLTTAKTSKPVSAREKKSSKKLFDSKEKNDLKFQQGHHIFNKLEHLMQGQQDEENQQVKQALHQLQQVLQGISSKKSVASELKKIAFKLKNIHSEENSQKDNSQQNSEEESNSDAFKKIKDFKNNLVKKKLNQASQQKKSQQKIVSDKKSSKKLLGKKKKLQDPHKRQQVVQIIHFDKKQISNENDLSRGSEPDAFKNTESEQSRYINSKIGSELYEQSMNKEQEKQPNQVLDEQNSQNQVLDQSNRKYMEFLKKLQAQNNHQMSDDKQIGMTEQQINNQYTLVQKNNFVQQNDNLIDEINNYLNRQVPTINRQYNSQNPKENLKFTEKDTNPMLQRRRGQCYETNKIQSSEDKLKNYQSDSQDQNYGLDSQQNEKKSQIQQLKSFQKKSDQMMQKIGVTKPDQKKKGLTIELNRSIEQQQNQGQKKQDSSTKNRFQSLKSPSSPKFQDHYPRVLKSPKISDIQITNILAVKQKCLASKHEKMNELIQRMYEKELVSPKSYQYYTHQIRRQFEEESEGFDGFKEQASEILNQINKQKQDIKAIDELIRQEKWEQARKLMKQDRKAASVFFGFKKSKEKVYESYPQQKQKPQIQQTKLQQISPSKKFKIGVIQNNINITINPSQTKPVIPINEKNDKQSISTIPPHKEKKQIFKGPPEGTNIQKGSLVRQKRKLPDSDSEEDESASQAESNSIAVKLDFEFQHKFRLKSNEDLNDQRLESSKLKLQQEFSDYLNVQKADSEDFQHYVYYQSDQNQKNLSSVSQNSNNEGENLTSARLKEQNVIKLIEVSKGNDDSKTIKQNNDKVIQIYEDQPVVQVKSSSFKLIQVPTVEKDDLHQQEDNLSESDSILQLELRKGFESNLFFIKQYCISLCEFIRDNGNKKSQFKTNITQPLEFDTIELLKKYRTTVNGDYDSNYNSSLTQLQYKTQYRKPVKKAISQELAREFNETYGPLKFWNVDLAKKGRAKFKMEKETEAIFLAAILEVLNESLDFERPGSIFGKPLIWANSSKHLKNMKYLNGQKTKKVSQDSQESAQTYDFIFGVAIARIIQWGSCLCGFLPDTAELQNTQIDDDYVVHIRQTRMAFLLEKMLAQEQATFNNSELEQTEIMLYLGKVIAQELVKEASQQIFNLNRSDSNES